MRGLPTHRRLPLLHLLVLASVMLALVARPVLGAWGESHELMHGQVAHLQPGEALPASVLDDTGQGEEDPALHALLELVHCCGHASAAPSPLLQLPDVPPGDSRLSAGIAPSPALARLETPFRPPITA